MRLRLSATTFRRRAGLRLALLGLAAALGWVQGPQAGWAAAAAAASATAPPPASAPPATGASAAPKAASAGISGVTLSRQACTDASAPTRCDPLSLERSPEALPAARLGQVYRGAPIRAEGGVPPYRFDVVQGQVPEGLSLDEQGQWHGAPVGTAYSSRFRVQVRDASGQTASQLYSLRVLRPTTPTAAARPASAAASVAPLAKLDPEHLNQAVATPVSALYFRLQADQLEPLTQAIAGDAKASAQASPATADAAEEAMPATPAEVAETAVPTDPPPLPAPPPGLVWSEAQQTQLQAVLAPLYGVDYPNRSLLAAAIDAQVCATAWQLIVQEAARQKQQAPSEADFATVCPSPAASRPGAAAAAPAASAARRSSSPTPDPAPGQPLAWRQLPTWLMPPGLRDWLVEQAQGEGVLLPPPVLNWVAAPGCGCNTPRTQPVYAIYPVWRAPQASEAGTPETLDFSLIDRISYFAVPLGEDLTTDPAEVWTSAQTAFVRTARQHGVKVDLGIYRRDWRFLATEPASAREALLQRFTDQMPRHVREWLDLPLSDLASRLKARLPGFGEVQHLGDGITVYFDELPDPARDPVLATRFADFYPRFVKGLARAMEQNPGRHYAINLVMTDRQLLAGGVFDVARLFELLKAVEDPDLANGRIVETHSDYRRNSNVELRFLVLLSEPSGDSKKLLRAAIESSSALHGGDRRIFLRSVVPLLTLPALNRQQREDDLVYIQDSFGGVGFWPAPLADVNIEAADSQALRRVFGPAAGLGISDALCSLVCPYRWWWRLLFELLLLLCVVAWLALQWRCAWRDRYGRYALLTGLPPLLIGAALLQCDPALQSLRDGNAQLIALLTIPMIAALWALLKTKEDRP